MKKAIDLLKQYSLVIILVVIALSMMFGGLDRCSRNNSNQLIEQTQIDQWRRNYKDSVDLAYLAREDAKLDSIKKVDSIETNRHEKRVGKLEATINKQDRVIKKLQGEANTAVTDYQNDTTAHSEKCDSAISKLQQVNDSLYTQTDSLKTQSKEAQLQAQGYKSQWQTSEKQLSLKDQQLSIKDNSLSDTNRINQQLRDQIKKDNNWWSRNEKWFYFGGGAISVAGLVYLLK